MRSFVFLVVALAVAAAVFVLSVLAHNDYLLFAGFVVLQYVVLATAWNILGGYCGYVNFGSAAFFAVGAYTTVALHKLGANPERYLSNTPFEPLGAVLPLSVPTLMLLGGMVAGLVGFGMGYLTLRLRGVFFAIATLAMAVVLQTFVVNWDFVGGSRGAYIIRPDAVPLGPLTLPYIQYLFLLMLLLAVLALWIARTIERSSMGLGFATIRDDEAAAEASGVPTLGLKLIATTVSGALMGMAGAPLPYYIGFVEPGAAFGLPYAVNSIAMPMIGGTTSWVGPLVGALLLGTLQQVATVTISSVTNLLIVGAMLVAFVIAAPNGIVGLIQQFLRKAAPARLDWRAVSVVAIASYCFVVGMVAIIFSLPVLQAGVQHQLPLLSILREPLRFVQVLLSTGTFWLGTAGVLIGALYVVSAYGVLELQRWGPPATAVGLLATAGLVTALAGLSTGQQPLAMAAGTIIVAIAGVSVLLNRKVRLLYYPVPA